MSVVDERPAKATEQETREGKLQQGAHKQSQSRRAMFRCIV